jgi:predicted Zn-dependent peptidase
MSSLALANGGPGKYIYESQPGQPDGIKIYEMANGMRIYMNVYKEAPRIQTLIAVRGGSKQDPADATGLAHYLEHMMFKGTRKIASLDWAKEEKLLQQISDLYEKHRQTTDPEQRKIIYGQIDSVSQVAANLVSTNEYDKMISSLGAKGTNAFTSNERTVYVNDIPSNELDKWMYVEGERFNEVVLRLFHTELEAVYEEFNIGQDNDFRKRFFAMMDGLFPTHSYGTQTTIGKGEHLKNPSHVKIKEYFDTYYVPNNMALIVAGEFNPADMVAKAEKYFGHLKTKPVPAWTFEPQTPITKTVVKEVIGKDPAAIQIGFRVPGAFTDEELLAELVSGILFNEQAGLMDINLIQKQIIGQGSYAFTYPLDDYSIFSLLGEPREGQSLDELKTLLFAELAKIRDGAFDEALISAVVRNNKLAKIKQQESNSGRAYDMLDAFIFDIPWTDYASRYDRMAKFNKQDVIDFAKKYLNDNQSVVVYKREGEDKDVVKVEKPSITPVQVNRDKTSDFKASFDQLKASDLKPDFIDFKSTLTTANLKNGVQVDYLKNTNNETFNLFYIFEMGKNNDKNIALAVDYLKYLGTDKYTAEALQKEFFKLGLSFDVSSSDDRVYVTLSGLDESFTEGVALFEHILANCKSDKAVWDNMVVDILKKRDDAKKDKRTILQRAMFYYAKNGPVSPMTDLMSKAELEQVDPSKLTSMINGLSSYEHKVFYFGSKTQKDVLKVLNKSHKAPKKRMAVPAPKVFPELETSKPKVYFVDFPMVQAEVMMINKGSQGFDLDQYVYSQLYNEYFGAGLSSIVFQEIRESKALAYSASVFATSPVKKDEAHYLRAYVGTQADKLKDAVTAMTEIIRDMPVSEEQILKAADGIAKKIESERVTKTNIYWLQDGARRRGFDYDLRKETYNWVKQNRETVIADLKKYQQSFVKNNTYTILILGEKSRLDMEYVKSLGEFQELTMEQIFGY